MKLISSAASPFVRKATIALIETGMMEQTEIVPVTTSPLASDSTLVAANPIGKIPALIRDDGPALYDSRLIARYLDATSGAGLYPEARLWDVLLLEATAEGVTEAAIAIVYEKRFRDEAKWSSEWIEAQWEKAARGLDVINDRWMSHLHGPFDMSHVGVGCALGYIDFRMPERNWREGREALADWYAEFETRPSMQATIPA
jgi:glutathione S-transferase